MKPSDRSYRTTYHQSAIATIAVLYHFLDFVVEKYRDLKIQVRGHSLREFMHERYIAQTYRPGAIS